MKFNRISVAVAIAAYLYIGASYANTQSHDAKLAKEYMELNQKIEAVHRDAQQAQKIFKHGANVAKDMRNASGKDPAHTAVIKTMMLNDITKSLQQYKERLDYNIKINEDLFIEQSILDKRALASLNKKGSSKNQITYIQHTNSLNKLGESLVSEIEGELSILDKMEAKLAQSVAIINIAINKKNKELFGGGSFEENILNGGKMLSFNIIGLKEVKKLIVGVQSMQQRLALSQMTQTSFNSMESSIGQMHTILNSLDVFSFTLGGEEGFTGIMPGDSNDNYAELSNN
jgi:hypothetical protein